MSDFLFKPFEEMTDADYAEIGFKSGLEIHQQLLTEKKLFCRCPAGQYSSEFHAEILRHMRPTLSELGEYDGTALMEFKTKKNIIYRINRKTVCTYEMDDTPPFEMNEQALDIAIEVGMLLKSNIVDEVHIARKQYLDGSIPTGFQRTAIVSVGGKIPYKDREINIIQMSLEEDSCREFSDMGHNRIYLTDRLGMPLIETVTAPEMRTPQEVAEVNNILRRLVRTTGKVRTGVGAAREDVNVSVEGGTRIEIKGVPSIKRIPLLTYNEAMRQWNLLRLRDELHKRGITAETFESKIDDVTKLLKHTRYQPIFNAIAEGKLVKCVTLRGFKGLLRWQTQTDTYFSNEISDRVRVIACLTTLPNIIHSDYQGETISSSEGLKIRKTVGATDDDTLVLVWGSEMDTDTATKEIIIRAREATIGIPSETRQAHRDGTNGFERILPGADRMYPDTDLPPKKIVEERLERIRKQLSTPSWERENFYRSLGLPDDIIAPLAISPLAATFDYAVKELKIEPKLAGAILISLPKRLKRKKLEISILNESVLRQILETVAAGKLHREGVSMFMECTVRNGEFSEKLLPSPCSKEELDTIVSNSLEILNNTVLHNPEKKKEVLMGILMDELRGRIASAEIIAIIDKELSGMNTNSYSEANNG
jgi:glutamyl-tRNA(Gln) amidotransferase subunit E